MAKTIFITGASRGFGLALSQVFWDNGWNIIGLVRSQSAKDNLKVRFNERFSVVISDLSGDSSVHQIQKYLSGVKLDILINNAGIKGGGKTIQTAETSEIENSFNVNCLGALRCVNGCLEALEASKNAKIINISSRFGSISRAAQGQYNHLNVSYAYRLSKAAMNMLTTCLAAELNQKGISAHSIHPGKLLTEVGMQDANMSIEIAAKNTFMAVSQLPDISPPLFLEPGVGEISW